MLTEQQATKLAASLAEEAETEWDRLWRFTRYYDGEHDKPQFSPQVERAFGTLWDASTVNNMQLAADVPAQRLIVNGYRQSQDDSVDSPPWLQWQASGMDQRQHNLHRSVMQYGYAYCSVLPAIGGPSPVRIRPLGPRDVYCSYADADDDWPEFAYRAHVCPSGGPCTVTVWDSDASYPLQRTANGAYIQTGAPVPNAGGVVPFVRFQNVHNLDSHRLPRGRIEPLIPLQDQLNRITFIINLIGERSSFTIKWMTGVEIPSDPVTGEPMSPWKNLPGEIMAIAGGMEGKTPGVGQFTPDNPSALIDYRDKIRRDLFSVAQLPPQYGGGQMVNISAEALAAADATLDQMLDPIKGSLGESHEQTLRFAAYLAGDTDSAADYTAQVWWQDSSPRSLAQTVDAAGKAVQMLGVPQEAAWLWLPGVTRQDVEDWSARNKRAAGSAVLAALAEKIQNGGTLEDGLAVTHDVAS